MAACASAALLRGSIGFSVGCDDNVLSTTTNKLGECSYTFLPSLALYRTTPLSKVNVSYSPGFVFHQKLSSYNEASHRAAADITFRMTPRWTLRLRESFSLSTSLFDTGVQGEPVFGPIQQPNSSIITPIAERFENSSGLDLSYQLTRRAAMGTSVSYTDLRFNDVGDSSATLIGSKSGTASAFYNYRLSPRQWVGVSYLFHKLWYEQGTWTVAHSVVYTHTFALTPSVSISLFGGPDYSTSNGQLVSQGGSTIRLPGRRSSWSPGAGGTFNVRKSRTAFAAGFTRRIADGSGLMGASRLNEAHASVSRRFTRTLTLSGNASYGQSRLLDSEIDLPIRTASVGGGLQKEIVRNLSLGVRYAWEHQEFPNNTLLLTNDANHNRGSITLTYSFSKPIGQ